MILYVAPQGTGEAYPVPAENVFILLHGDGGNGSTTFVDSGPQNLTATVVGGIAQSTTAAKFGVSSIGPITGASANYFYVTADVSARTVDKFTFEAFVYHVSSSNFATSPVLLSIASYNASNVLDSNSVLNVWNYANSAKLEFNTSGFGVEVPQVAYSSSTWTHFAVEFDGALVKFYVGGVFQGSASYIFPSDSNTMRLTVGNEGASGSNNSVIYLDEIRLVMNQVVYGGAFTPPSTPFLPA